jgi:hypothetical protein
VRSPDLAGSSAAAMAEAFSAVRISLWAIRLSPVSKAVEATPSVQ